MALVTKTYTFSSGAVIVAAEHNTNFDTLYNLVNGNIDNANIASGAAIADTKFAQITTASKVSGAAITGLASVPSGAGVLPVVNSPAVQVKVGTLTRDMTASSGSVAYTGVGFQPTAIIFIGNKSGSTLNFTSWGVDDATTAGALGVETALGVMTSGAGTSINMYESGTQAQTAKVSAFGSDGFTLAWTKAGTPSAGTAGIIYLAFR